MRDVSFKITTLRTARASAELTLSPETLLAVQEGRIPKGNPLEIAKAAAVIAAKKTAEWIPYCHNIPIEFVGVEFDLQADRIVVEVTVKSVAKTGVEMEAMTAASAAALTLYDMLKMLDEGMEILSIKLLEKRGGKSDAYSDSQWTGAVLTVSDRVARGEYADISGPILAQGLEERGAESVVTKAVPDEPDQIIGQVKTWAAENRDIILITGGTGISPRDRTPETLVPFFDLHLPGVAEALRSYGQDRLQSAMFTRSVAGVIGSSVIVCLPGSPNACRDALHALFPALIHAKAMLTGAGHP